MIVTVSIIGVLSSLGVVTVGKISNTSQQTMCVNNLRNISQGLQLYYNDFGVFPDDGYLDADNPDDGNPDDADVPLPLSTHLAGYINNKPTFVCPEDKDTTSTGNFASYDPYYVARKGSYYSDELAIGCPRHRGAKNATSAFSTGSTEITSVGTVLANGQEIPPDGTTAERTISLNDVMTFDDDSTVEVTGVSGESFGCILVQSVQLADGTLYSIIKVQDDGIIDVVVTPGSKFEIVTPSAIVGVRGTEFTVTTSNRGFTTEVELTKGTIIMMDRTTGESTTLFSDGITPALDSVDQPMHPHFHYHVDGTYHDHSHPSLNNAHHGNPAAAKKAAAASTVAKGIKKGKGKFK